MNNILSLINPARIIKVEDAMKVAQIEMPIGDVMYNDTERKARAYDLLQGLESLYALKLEKGHFVCEVEKPSVLGEFDKCFAEQSEAYNEHQAKVIFEGFEVRGDWMQTQRKWLEVLIRGGYHFEMWAYDNHVVDLTEPTIGDLFHAIEVYNRTAATPIELKYTSNILSLLKIEG